MNTFKRFSRVLTMYIFSVFKTTLQAQITQINTAMMLLGTELPKLQGSVQKAQGVLTALTAISVGAALDANNVAMIKTALASTSTAIGLISPQIVSLTITIMSENMVSAAVAKPLSGITTSLNAVIATITTEVAKQADTLKKSVATNLMSVNTAISGFTTKLQGMYTDTIVPPVMTETIKACEDYNLAVSTSLNLVNTGFSAQATLLLDPKAEMGNLYVKDVAAILASVNVDANKIVKYMITALKQNSVVARTCVMKTMATAGTIFTVAAAQFDSCLKIVLPTFSDEEKLGEDALKVITKKAVDYMGQMATCMTPTTGTTNQRKVIVNCLKDVSMQNSYHLFLLINFFFSITLN